MLFVPLPFVVALLLVILLLRMLRAREGDDVLFMALVSLYAVQSVLIGLRWGYGIREVLAVQSVLASALAALAFVAFSQLADAASSGGTRRFPVVGHAAPAGVVALLLLVHRDGIGLALILIFLGYGIALLRLAAKGPDALVAARLDGALRSHRALQVTGVALVGSALTDILISLDHAVSAGVHSGAVVAFANMLALLLLGVAASAARPSDESAEDRRGGVEDANPPSPPAISEEDVAMTERLDAVMRAKGLYRDVDLNLDRLSRRLGVPSRRVSAAVNRVHATSVSQYVNGLRIEEACRLLADTDDPVTKIMFDAGFLSKSNFNREFQRVTGTSPRLWRAGQRPGKVALSASDA